MAPQTILVGTYMGGHPSVTKPEPGSFLLPDGTAKATKSEAGRRTVTLFPELRLLLRKWQIKSPYTAPEDLIVCATGGLPVMERNLRGARPADRGPGYTASATATTVKATVKNHRASGIPALENAHTHPATARTPAMTAYVHIGSRVMSRDLHQQAPSQTLPPKAAFSVCRVVPGAVRPVGVAPALLGVCRGRRQADGKAGRSAACSSRATSDSGVSSYIVRASLAGPRRSGTPVTTSVRRLS